MNHKLERTSHATSRDGEAGMRDRIINGHAETGKSTSQVAAHSTRQRVNKPEVTDGRLTQFGKNDDKERKGACSPLRPTLLLLGKKRWVESLPFSQAPDQRKDGS